MIDEGLRKRFCDIAIRKGFITKEHFVKAMAFQIENELKGKQPRLIGSILNEKGYMTEEQIDEVIEVMAKPDIPKCPECGTMPLICSNCGAYLR
ncbi:hypothetical protein ACFL9T_19660 [Thermodesulfobacteriota bacterium]